MYGLGILFTWTILRVILISSCIHLPCLPSFHSEFSNSLNNYTLTVYFHRFVNPLTFLTVLWFSWFLSFFSGNLTMDTNFFNSLALKFKWKLKCLSSLVPSWNTCCHFVSINKGVRENLLCLLLQCLRCPDNWEVLYLQWSFGRDILLKPDLLILLCLQPLSTQKVEESLDVSFTLNFACLMKHICICLCVDFYIYVVNYF